jgi:hypothetical protein
MDGAMDRNPTRAVQRSLIALGLVSIITTSMPGCAEFPRRRGSDGPKIGGMKEPGVDPYLAHHGTTPSKPDDLAARDRSDDSMSGPSSVAKGTTTVRSTIHPTSPSGRPADAGAAPSVIVEFGTPIVGPIAIGDLPVVTLEPPRSMPVLKDVDQLDEARKVVAKSRATLNAMSSYQVKMNRQERVGDVLQPPEDVVLSIRREPKAVRLEWPTGPHKGREVLFAANDPSGLLHVNTSVAGVPVPPLHVAPDSPMVMRSSRHPITEAGFDTILANLEKGLSKHVDGSKIAYQGVETPPSLAQECHKLLRETPTAEIWHVYIDTRTSLPALVEATDKSGQLLERYFFREVAADLPELATAEAFDPNLRWTSSRSLLGRLARTAVGDAKPTASPAPR